MLDFAAATRLTRQLAELPELITYAHLALMPGSGPRGARVSGATRSAPLPLRLDALSDLGPAAASPVRDPYGDQAGRTPVAGIIAGWVRLHLEESDHRLGDGTLGGQLAYLARRPVRAWAVLQPWADEYAAEIDDTHRALQPYALLRARRRLLQVPCPRCQLLTLVVEDGKDAECENPGCGVILRPAEVDDRIERYLLEINAAA